ncbi:MAG: hypothetical protein MJY62_02020 [Bacteroidales bacterium]|nr:hypothetical protein [Bacteroidales bacterium]
MKAKLDLFYAIVSDNARLADPSLSFDRICREIAVSKADFNRYLLDTVGYTGEEIMDSARNDLK